jgi:2-dehydro-3-deoxygalactonokinase
VERSKQSGELSHLLFGVRTLVLTGRLKDSSASSYLSGILIGREVWSMVRKEKLVHLVGEPALCSLYAKALVEYGVKVTVEPSGSALRGLKRIARALMW